MARILVTGGSGFIGTNLVEHYRVRGDQVINLDCVPPRNPEHGGLWRKADLLDREGLARAVADADPEIVFHMAARTDLEGKTIRDYPANCEGVMNLIDALSKVHTLRLAVFASSMLVCSLGYRPTDESDYCPITAYGESKVEGELVVRKEAAGRFSWVIVRPTSIWGPWFGPPYCDFFTAVQRGLYMHPRGRRIHRSYGFVLNSVIQLDRLAVVGGAPLLERTVYLADYEPIELKHWADAIQHALGARPVREVPLWLLQIGATAGDLIKHLGYATPPLNSFRLKNLLTEMIHDTEPLRATCGDLPYSMEQGARITCDWFLRNPA
jgi:nucleoside-diphosphate-sugar epimerase